MESLVYVNSTVSSLNLIDNIIEHCQFKEKSNVFFIVDHSVKEVNRDLVNGDNVDTCQEEAAASCDIVSSELQKESEEIDRIEEQQSILNEKINFTFFVLIDRSPLFYLSILNY